MAHESRITGVVAAALGLGWAGLALQLPLREAGSPGPAFVPLIVGLLMAAAGLGVTAQARGEKGAGPTWPDRGGSSRVIVAFAAMAGYIALTSLVGFLPPTALFLAFIIRLWGGYRWRVVLPLAGLLAGASYVVFRVWLEVPLPPGSFL